MIKRTLSAGRKSSHPPASSFRQSISSGREGRIALSAVAGAGARGIGLAGTIVIVPIALRSLGAERFGMWVTIASFGALLAFADLGMASGLVNAASEANARNDQDEANEYVSSAFFGLTLIALAGGLAFLLLYSQVSWAGLFRVGMDRSAQEAGPATAVFVGCFLLTMPLGTAQRVHMGYQEGFLASLWSAGGSVLSFSLVLLFPIFRSSLPWFVLAMAGGPAVAGLANSIALFGLSKPYLRPRLSRVTRGVMKRLAQLGVLFFGLSLASAIGSQSDNMVLARLLGAESVTLYAVPQKLFLVGPTLLSFVLMPMWPAYREAITVGDVAWVRRAFRRSLKLGFFINVPLATAFWIFGPQLVEVWTSGAVDSPDLVYLGFALWAMQTSFLGPVAMLFNGANVIRFQVLWASAMAVTNICLSIVLVKAIGVSGAIFGTVVAQLLFLVLPYAVRTKSLFANLSRPAGTTAGEVAAIPESPV